MPFYFPHAHNFYQQISNFQTTHQVYSKARRETADPVLFKQTQYYSLLERYLFNGVFLIQK